MNPYIQRIKTTAESVTAAMVPGTAAKLLDLHGMYLTSKSKWTEDKDEAEHHDQVSGAARAMMSVKGEPVFLMRDSDDYWVVVTFA